MFLSFTLPSATISAPLLPDGTGAHLTLQYTGLETKTSGELIIYLFCDLALCSGSLWGQRITSVRAREGTRAPDWGQGAGQACQRQVATGFETTHVRPYWSSGWGTLPKDLDAGLDAELLVSSICLKLLSLPDIFLSSL